MSSSRQTAEKVSRELDYVINAVIERGYHDNPESAEDYGELLASSFEHRQGVTFQLYDSYFPPKRHEFELKLLTLLVEAVAKNQVAAFLGVAVVTGVVGNAAYDILKLLLAHLCGKLKPIRRTHAGFKEIEKNTHRLMQFFEERSRAGTTEISEAIGADADKVEPLLKLLGFRCRRRGKRRIWFAPESARAVQTKHLRHTNKQARSL